jgi:hypothetical protein
MIVLAILFGWAILLHGGGFEAVYGSPALRLDPKLSSQRIRDPR